MKKIFRAFLMSMSMFCAVPLRIRKWDEEARPLMTLCLPFVGAVIGGLWTLTAFLLRRWEVPSLIGAACLCAFPFLITGCIHLDGYLDVTDAVRSWRGKEERIRILKDPHVGSFAVAYAVLLMLGQFAALASLGEEADLFAFLLLAVVSRTVAALCVTVLRPLSTSEYAGPYRQGIRPSHVVFLLAVLTAAVTLGFVFLGRYGWVSAAAAAGYLTHLIRGFRSLGGMSGDISGYAMTFAEFCGIVCLALL